MTKQVTASIRLHDNRIISEKNIEKIYARHRYECRHKYDKNGLVKGYFEVHRVKKEPEGYIFREVRFNSGINGHHKTLRSLILSTLICFGSQIDIFVED